MLIPTLIAAGLAVLGQGCQRGPLPDVRVVPSADARATSTEPRVRIGDESRFVMASAPTTVLRAREQITLPPGSELRIPVALPRGFAGRDVRLDAFAAMVEIPAQARDDPKTWRSRTLAVDRILWGADGDASPELVLPLPPHVGGAPAALTVVARVLPEAAVQGVDSEPVDVPYGARLDFGYAVESLAWGPEWPPVAFRVLALGDRPLTLFERRIDPSADPRDRRWFDASVDLAPLVGRRVRFRFESEAVGSGGMIDRSFAVFANPIVVRSVGGRQAPRRNLVLMSIDTLRARSVSAYGHFNETTPSIDRRLAAAGAFVRTAVAPFPLTTPSHMTMLTGLEPCAHGVREIDDRLAPEHVTLAEALRAAGYETAAFTEDALLFSAVGFERGFDVYHENRSAEFGSPGFAAETFGAARAWLASHGERPFFLFVHTYQVHDPYLPPRGYAGLFPNNVKYLGAYEDEIRYTDDVIADFLDELDARGWSRDTIVVLTSDHGEAFGEHVWGHGYDLHDEALLVPLIVRAPGLVPAGRVVEQQVGLVDLTPTLLDLLGLPAFSGVQGRSFAGPLLGDGRAYEERPLMGVALPDLSSIRTPRFKYLTHGRIEQFYDLSSDPGERNNLAREGGPSVAEARAALEAARAACAAARPAERAATSSEPAPQATDPDGFMRREEIQRKLRSLGYVQ